jgi:glycosyltransferase involved in cell wall biosynthesis
MFNRALCLACGRWAERNGARVSALVLNDDSTPDARYVNGGFASYVGTKKSKLRFTQNYLRHIMTKQYEQIIFGHAALSPLALIARRLRPLIKLSAIAHGVEVWCQLPKTQRLALHQMDLILAVSDYTKDELVRNNALPPEKIRVFPNTLDPYWGRTSQPAPHESATPIILSVTRMNKDDRYKGIDSVIKSLPKVLEEVGPVQYRIVGEGSDLPRLRALAAGLGLGRYVSFLGGVPDAELREQYRQCSLFIMPSRKEGFGIVFLEAMAYSKPVIGGAHGGTPSVIKDGETGLLVNSSDVEAISQSITRLLRDEEMRETFGRMGHQRLTSEFTFDRFEQNLDEVFLSLS